MVNTRNCLGYTSAEAWQWQKKIHRTIFDIFYVCDTFKAHSFMLRESHVNLFVLQVFFPLNRWCYQAKSKCHLFHSQLCVCAQLICWKLRSIHIVIDIRNQFHINYTGQFPTDAIHNCFPFRLSIVNGPLCFDSLLWNIDH